MTIGLGKIVGLGLLSQFMGGGKGLLGGEEPQQPTQTASNNTNQGGGFLSGISNQMFKGMSPEQVARLGIGFNSMRLEPDDSMAASFQSTIDTATAKTNRNATVDALIKMGKPNLANLVSTNAMDVKTAMTLAFKEVKGDVNGTIAWMETFRGEDVEQNAKIDSYRALIESAKGDEVAIREYVKMFSNDFGVGAKDLKDTTSAIQIQQKDGTVMGVTMKEGQKYTIVTDEFGNQKINIIEGAFGESASQQYLRELDEQENADDRSKAIKYSDEAFIEATAAIDSVQKYQNVQRTLKNPDGTFNKDAISGWITNMLPNFKSEQAVIKSTANLMGIDVINMATFGALSEREMKMAMQTNLDTDLSPRELYKQIVEMVESRQKLAQEMYERSRRISELGSWKAYQKEFAMERQGHIKSRYKVMNDDVKKHIRGTQYQVYQSRLPEGVQAMDFATWDKHSDTMSAYEAWSYVNWNDRAAFIADMPGMTYDTYFNILGKTELAQKWWESNEGVN
jgi:hypothetical protein